MKSRDLSLDFLKIIATFAVVKLHSGYFGFISEIIHYLCGFAVPVFFMVSGALMLNRDGGIQWNYSFKRVYRIFFLITIWTVPVYVLNVAKQGGFVNPIVIFFQSLFQHGVLGHFWYLWTLVFLTIFSPFLYKLLQEKKTERIMTSILLIVCIICHCVSLSLNEMGYSTIEMLVPQAFRIWSHLLYFWLGGVIYKYRNECPQNINKNYLFIIFGGYSISVAFYQYVFCTRYLDMHSPENLFNSPIIILWICMFFVFISSFKIKEKEGLLITNLVLLSLGIYIIHPFIISGLRFLGWWEKDNWLVNFLALSTISTFLSYVIYKIPVLNRIIKI